MLCSTTSLLSFSWFLFIFYIIKLFLFLSFKCLAVVDRVYHNLVTYFENKITPEDVCIELGLCKADDTIEPTNPTFKEQCQIQEIITNDDYNSLLYFPSICKQVFNDESVSTIIGFLLMMENL